MAHTERQVRIGTSGWHYRHWRGPFYPADLPPARMLDFYRRHFDTVELNNTFYRLPTGAAVDAWRASVPKGFTFAAKASRFLTHNKKLRDPENALENFLPLIERLDDKLGPILFQLPPKWRVNVDRLEALLQALPRQHDYAFELREPSWFDERVYDVLRRHNAALCIYELAGFHAPLVLTADFTYVRLHGPGGKYQGRYSQAALQGWAAKIRGWLAHLRAIYVYFDNDQAGYAAHNALELRRLVAGAVKTRRAA